MWNDYEQQDLFRKKVEGLCIFNATHTYVHWRSKAVNRETEVNSGHFLLASSLCLKGKTEMTGYKKMTNHVLTML